MKKQVSDFIKSLGASTRYSGKTKTMYIKGGSPHIEETVLNVFGYGLPFKLDKA